MRTRAHFIQHRIRILANTDVKLTWTERAGTVTPDPVTGEPDIVGIKKTLTVKAFVHTVQIGTSQIRQFNEVQDGDMIVDFPDTVDLSNKPGLSFEITGRQWVAKEITDDLAETWDATVANVTLAKSVLLRRSK